MHYGVLGMKWGVRKKRPSSKSKGILKRKKKKEPVLDVSTMTDQELRERINRLQMERQYEQLTAKEKSKGRVIVEQVMAEIGREYVRTFIRKGIESGTSHLKTGIEGTVSSVLDPRRRLR